MRERQCLRRVDGTPVTQPTSSSRPRTPLYRSDMRRQEIRDLDSRRRHPRLMTPLELEEIKRSLLTASERKVLPLLAEGRPTREIASELHLSEGTVRTQVHSILVKLSVLAHSNPPDLPPRRPAASAALSVPVQEPSNALTHAGRHMPRETS